MFRNEYAACIYARARACVRVRVYVCVRARARVCGMCVCTF